MANKYPGYCIDCRADVPAGHGDLKKVGSRWQVTCGGKGHVAQQAVRKSSETPIPEGTKTYNIGGGSGYGYRAYKVGEVVRTSDRLQEQQAYPEWLFVLRAKSVYVREDGMSFGVGDESGYYYSATCREATPEEAAPAIAARRRAATVKEAKAQLEALKRQIREQGDHPRGEGPDPRLWLEGERYFDTQNIYGGGDWFVVEPEHVWYCVNNGTDGGDWSMNNIRTGGAGAIGWRVPRSESLVSALNALRDLLAGAIEDEARERELFAMIADAKFIREGD